MFMPKRNINRAYKRGEAHRDARLFIIVTEGEREDKYFGWFDRKNQRIRVQLVPRQEQASAPKHFLNRLHQFLDTEGIDPQIGDNVWFVLDVDKWTRESIDALIIACEQNNQWHIAISNPCFEVWLNLHHGPLPGGDLDCNALKTMLNTRHRGGFHPDTICPLLDDAIRYAQEADTHPEQMFPGRMQTKVHSLAVAMSAVLGQNWR
ncbi:MAG TPA: RloB family protein [Saprospiraceae bacterium]|nr:RloB family protein [Saprospiraceae bacterium]